MAEVRSDQEKAMVAAAMLAGASGYCSTRTGHGTRPHGIATLGVGEVHAGLSGWIRSAHPRPFLSTIGIDFGIE